METVFTCTALLLSKLAHLSVSFLSCQWNIGGLFIYTKKIIQKIPSVKKLNKILDALHLYIDVYLLLEHTGGIYA